MRNQDQDQDQDRDRNCGQAVRIDVDGIELQVRDSRREGEAIVFLHFSGANLMMWKRAISSFNERYRTVLIDLRGHGRSDRSLSGYAIDTMARDVVRVMECLDIEQAHIIGSSLGAEVGLHLAADFPDKAISLVCEGAPCSEFGPYSTWEGSEEAFAEHVSNQLGKMRATADTTYASMDELVDARRGALQSLGWWNEDIEAMVRYGTRLLGGGSYVESFGRQALSDYMEHYFHKRFEDDYRRVLCPLLIGIGEGELEDPREAAAVSGLCDLAAQGRMVEVPGWVHPYGWLLDPDPMCKAILRFLPGPD